MLHPRVIACLLLRRGGLVKTLKFKDPRYVGDPINAVRILNEKEVDEIAFLDIDATCSGVGPDFDLLADIASEAFVPFSYGGGITTVDQVQRLYKLGVEKIVINSAAAAQPSLVTAAAEMAGSSGVVVSIDVRKNWLGKYSVFVESGRRDLKRSPIDYAREMERLGAGELFLTSMDNDGTMAGYDLNLIRQVSAAVSIPVVAAGGAGNLSDFREAVRSGASAVAAGSMFVFHGKHRAVLITYPEYRILQNCFT
ncbi:imidazole glycerol phosphate synthase subunit HisF [Ramlibacter sp. AW1]|uniref:imidazole glycerol-phosphate synthase n=1 Tax=Ramlibacter aurantiacus TaxID=2801330 RepID=A0A937D0L5_9BURK|nr:AglZ/HisF2 family acetamidino modification protein [Ramlibacter aurantiacus]MBL0419554.1 imidazole glycerol phosphate synthase subunit HisF [Ramlibacter aurantiacus]